MIKQMVDFSKKLEESGFYSLKNYQQSDLLYVVILPENKRNFYFVLDDNLYEKFPQISFKNVKKIDDIDDELRKILKNVKKFTKKLPGDEKGNKSIGANKGTNSYNLFIFQSPRNKIDEKILRVYNEKTLNSSQVQKIIEKIPRELNLYDNETEKFIEELKNLVKSLSFTKEEAEKLSFNVQKISNEVFGKDLSDVNKNIYFVFDIPNKVLYKAFYNVYIKQKIFVVEDKKYMYKGKCPICGKEEILSLPFYLNTLNEKKPFLRNLGRKIDLNILMCADCSLKVVNFISKFLSKVKIFPLFVDENLRDFEITYFNENLEKYSFRDILQQVVENIEGRNKVLDFYLILYQNDFVYIDFVSNFKYKFKDKNVFEIEKMIDYLFDNRLKGNYFGEVSVKDENLKKIIYKYRTLIFDFVYRAKYDSLNREIIDNIFYDVLAYDLKKSYKDNGIKFLEKLENYKILNKIFGGDFMENLDSIDLGNLESIENNRQYYYLLGKITGHLLKQSNAAEKTHSMVEPFINVSNSEIMLERIIELFNKYKHAIKLDNTKFSRMFKLVLEYFNSGKVQEKITKNDKFYFFEGYFEENSKRG